MAIKSIYFIIIPIRRDSQVGKMLDFQTNVLSRSAFWSGQFFFFFFLEKTTKIFGLVHGPQRVNDFEDAIQVSLYSSGRLDMSSYSSRSCRMLFMEEKAASKLPDRLII